MNRSFGRPGPKALFWVLMTLAPLIAARGVATQTPREQILAASAVGNLPQVKILLAAGADINSADAKGGTPLFLAALKGHPKLVRYLRAQRGNISEMCRYQGALPRHEPRPCPRFRGTPRTFSEFCMAGDLVHVRKMLKEKPWLASAMDQHDKKPINAAVAYGQTEIVKLLLQSGASSVDGGEDLMPIELADFYGNLDIYDLLRRKRGTIHDFCAVGDLGKVREMLDADPKLLESPSGIDDGATPLEVAVQNGKTDVVKFLVGRGADVNAKTTDHPYTPLYYACKNGLTEVAAVLLTHGADPNLKAGPGGLPIDAARTWEISALLVAKGARVRAPMSFTHDSRQRELLPLFITK